MKSKHEVTELIDVWGEFFRTHDWQQLIAHTKAQISGCGTVYELTNQLHRPDEGVAIVDMRNILFAEPHYHHSIEIYFIIQGSGQVVVGNHIHNIFPGAIIVTPANTAHYVIPEKDVVMGVINTPPFTTDDYFVLHETDTQVGFDSELFKQLRPIDTLS